MLSVPGVGGAGGVVSLPSPLYLDHSISLISWTTERRQLQARPSSKTMSQVQTEIPDSPERDRRTFTQHLLPARHTSEYITFINSFTPLSNLWNRYCYYQPFAKWGNRGTTDAWQSWASIQRFNHSAPPSPGSMYVSPLKHTKLVVWGFLSMTWVDKDLERTVWDPENSLSSTLALTILLVSSWVRVFISVVVLIIIKIKIWLLL